MAANRIKKIRGAQARDEAALIPFIVGAIADLDTTRNMSGAGGSRRRPDRLGVPFSRSDGDGPANQRSYARGIGRRRVAPGDPFMVSELRATTQIPLVFRLLQPDFSLRMRAVLRRRGPRRNRRDALRRLPRKKPMSSKKDRRALTVSTSFFCLRRPRRSTEPQNRALGEWLSLLRSRDGRHRGACELDSSLASHMAGGCVRHRFALGVGFANIDIVAAAQVAKLADAVVVGSTISLLSKSMHRQERARGGRRLGGAMKDAMKQARRAERMATREMSMAESEQVELGAQAAANPVSEDIWLKCRHATRSHPEGVCAIPSCLNDALIQDMTVSSAPPSTPIVLHDGHFNRCLPNRIGSRLRARSTCSLSAIDISAVAFASARRACFIASFHRTTSPPTASRRPVGGMLRPQRYRAADHDRVGKLGDLSRLRRCRYSKAHSERQSVTERNPAYARELLSSSARAR